MPESTAVWVFGHARTASLSYGLYSKGMDLKPLKEAVSVIPVSGGWGTFELVVAAFLNGRS